MVDAVATNQTIMVVGGGISGLTAAIEAAECGKQVILLEKNPSVGGRITQLYKYFPKMCYPTCGLEINLRRLKASKNIRLLTMVEVGDVAGEAGNYKVSVTVQPRFVNEKCTACGDCAKDIETEFEDEYNYGMTKRKGVYLAHKMAYPQRYVIDPRVIGTTDADKAKAACKYDAVDLDMQEQTMELTVGAIIWATGWRPYDAAKIQLWL
jgi:quinone-modifying oxidoreductase subunit QmoA